MRFFSFIILIAIFVGCKKTMNNEAGNRSDTARSFQIEYLDSFRKLTVFNPWEKAKGVEVKYHLNGDSVLSGSGIKTPVKKVVCLSTSHVAFIDALGELDAIVGVSGTNLVSNPVLKKRVENGEVVEIGYGGNMNYEELIRLNPDVVFAYGVSNEVVGFINRLKSLGIKVVLIAEYLENDPLGKVEWIKFFAEFFDKKQRGEQYFDSISYRYNKLKKQVSHVENKPTVMTGMPFNEQWWVPGGESYFAHMLEDAGARYLWEDNSGHESFVVDREEVILESSKAIFWLNTGSYGSYSAIEDMDSRFSTIQPFLQKMIYNNDKDITEGGGNNFWEEGVVCPDKVLHDLISIFHPEKINTNRKFYRKIDEK